MENLIVLKDQNNLTLQLINKKIILEVLFWRKCEFSAFDRYVQRCTRASVRTLFWYYGVNCTIYERPIKNKTALQKARVFVHKHILLNEKNDVQGCRLTEKTTDC